MRYHPCRSWSGSFRLLHQVRPPVEQGPAKLSDRELAPLTVQKEKRQPGTSPSIGAD